MKLSQLIDATETVADPDITSLATDSRVVKPGCLFASFAGKYCQEAYDVGASAFLVSKDSDFVCDRPVIRCDDPRRDFALLSARFYPAKPSHLMAVTGTNGKTSVVYLTQQILNLYKISACSIGTLGISGAITMPGSMTTPDSHVFFAALNHMAGNAVDTVVMEASSHGLHQKRFFGCFVNAAVFTNLSHDHLDYHSDMQSYWAAKRLLFTDYLAENAAIIACSATQQFQELKMIAQQKNARFISYGYGDDDIKILNAQTGKEGLSLNLQADGKRYEAALPLYGNVQAENFSAALCLAQFRLQCDFKTLWEKLLPRLQLLSPVPGRLEPVKNHPKNALVFIDYAHTPDALMRTLESLRHLATEGRLICVFGCGGNRDAAKRASMGEIASRYADLSIITDDNPRHEDPARIRAAILAHLPAGIEIADRAQAIFYAVSEAGSKDVVVIAGKGHETGQEIAGITYPFSDRQKTEEAIFHMIEGRVSHGT